MYTLVDFITHIKGVEYILSLLAIGGFLLFWEVLKPAPFRTLVNTGRQDLDHLQQTGYRDFLKSMGKLASAPFIGLAYLVMLPVGFAAALIIGGTNLMLKGLSGILGKNMSFDWRPMEAYFSGKKREKGSAEE
ncbi:MAG: hypothetical protein ACM3MD_11035 [Betaproteobacteria bacterium]